MSRAIPCAARTRFADADCPGFVPRGGSRRRARAWVAAAALALLLACAPASAAAWCEDWTRDDTWLAAAYGAALAADVATSDYLFREHGRHETNPLLPRHPSRAQLLAAAAVSAAGVGAVACALDAPWRGYWLAFAFGVEAHVVYRSAVLAREAQARITLRW